MKYKFNSFSFTPPFFSQGGKLKIMPCINQEFIAPPPPHPPVDFVTSARRMTDPHFLQWCFQRSDGVPVHLKGGLIDKLLYRTTMGLTIGGALYCLVVLYSAAQPSNKWFLHGRLHFGMIAGSATKGCFEWLWGFTFRLYTGTIKPFKVYFLRTTNKVLFCWSVVAFCFVFFLAAFEVNSGRSNDLWK